MTTTTGPQIACQRCGTTVPWSPYCPHCSAYLEFAGVPPWSPDGPPAPPETEPEPEPVEPASGEPASDEVAEATAPGETTPGETTPGETTQVAEPADEEPADEGPAPVEFAAVSILGTQVEGADTLAASAAEVSPSAEAVPEPPAVIPSAKPESAVSKWWRGMGRLRPQQVGGYLFGIALALLMTALFGLLGGWSTAWFAAPFLVLVAIIAMAAFGTVPDVEHADELAAEAARIAAEEEAARLEAEAEAARIAAEEEAARLAAQESAAESVAFTELVGADAKGLEEMASRPPQPVERTVKAGRAKSANQEAVRDAACLTCGRLNIATHRLCEYCGASMEGAQVKPPVEPVLETKVLETEEQEKKKRRRRKSAPSKSWRAPVAVIAIIGVVVSAFALAFFGPAAFQFRFGTVRVYQLVARWINPYLGETASVATVTASSNLTGADATEAGFGDARTFWASAPAQGYGAGSELVFTLDRATEIDRMVIFPGIQNGQFDIRALATPKDITLEFQDGTTFDTTLAEVESPQQQRQLITFDPENTGWVKLTINSVFPPRGQPADGVGSVALSGSQFLESPAAPQFFGVQDGVRAPSLPGLGTTQTQ